MAVGVRVEGQQAVSTRKGSVRGQGAKGRRGEARDVLCSVPEPGLGEGKKGKAGRPATTRGHSIWGTAVVTPDRARQRLGLKVA